MSRSTTALAAATVAAALALPAAARAHVTVNPREATAGAFTKLDVRVPNERDAASTVKVQLELPDGFAFASYEPHADWHVRVERGPLAKPITSHGEEISEGVKRITWTGDGTGLGRIAPGQFQEFPLSVQIPESAAGTSLTFKAIQTYSNGEVVRWIGAPDAETPAPTLKVAAAAEAAGHGAATTAAPTASTPASSDDAEVSGVAGLIVGGAGLLVALAALVLSRRRISVPARQP